MILHRFRIGDKVREKDGRHEGAIIAITSTVYIRVKWDETGWLSDLDYTDIERV